MKATIKLALGTTIDLEGTAAEVVEAIKAAITPSSPRPWAPSSETHVVSVYGNDFDKASYECAMPTRTVVGHGG